MEHLYCIDKSEKDVFLEGQRNSDKYVWLQLLIEKCNEDNSCNLSMYPNYRLAFYYSDNAVIPSSKENPFKSIGTSIYWNSSLDYTKQISMQFRDTLLQTDLGFLIKDLKDDRTFKFSK